MSQVIGKVRMRLTFTISMVPDGQPPDETHTYHGNKNGKY